jgi:hypothetical protein
MAWGRGGQDTPCGIQRRNGAANSAAAAAAAKTRSEGCVSKGCTQNCNAVETAEALYRVDT